MDSNCLLQQTLRNRIKGIVFGAAIGDAVGLATEFMDKETARKLYGNGPIQFGASDKGYEFWRDGHRSRWHANDFTDDTGGYTFTTSQTYCESNFTGLDQLLLILQCILSSEGSLHQQHFAYRLKEWTQIGFPELGMKMACGVGLTVGSTLGHPDFLHDPFKASFQVWDRTGRKMAANGAVMRTSILGIPFFWDEMKVAENAIKCAKVTHADPRSVFSSVVVSVIISRMMCMTINGSNSNPDKQPNIFSPLSSSNITQLVNLMESGSDNKSTNPEEGHYNSSSKIEPKKIPEPEVAASSSYNFLNQLRDKTIKLFKKDDNYDVDVDFTSSWPKHKEPDSKRLKNPAKITRKSRPFEVDEVFNKLSQGVIDDYKFLLNGSQILSASDCNSGWIEEMEKYCLNMPTKTLEDFELDHKASIGYTYKCLGSALFCFTRKIPTELTESEFFKELITQLTLEAGDADTNCAVAGALLGSRLGITGLPKTWTKGIRHSEFLTSISDQLYELVEVQRSLL